MEDSIPNLPSTPSDDDAFAYIKSLASEPLPEFDPSRLVTLRVPQRFRAGDWTVFGSRNIQIRRSFWKRQDGQEDLYLAGANHQEKIPDFPFRSIAGYGYTLSFGASSLDDDVYRTHVARANEWADAFLLPSDSRHLQNYLRRRTNNVLIVGLFPSDVMCLSDVVLSMRDGCEHVQILGEELRYSSDSENPPPIDFSNPEQYFDFRTPRPVMVFVVEPRSANPQLSKVNAYCLSTACIDFFQELLLSIKREWNIFKGIQPAKSPYAGLPPGWAYQVKPIGENTDAISITTQMIIPIDEDNFSEQDMSEESAEDDAIQTYLPTKSLQSVAKDTDQQLRDLFAQGKTIKQMAQALTMSESTVKRDLKRLELKRR